jgi:hypothetical protein
MVETNEESEKKVACHLGDLVVDVTTTLISILKD